MAYVLGYLYADGSMEDASYIRGKYIRVSSTERINILKIKKLLNSKHKIYEESPKVKNRKKRYLLRIGSHKLYSALEKHGLYPNKSLKIKFPSVPRIYLHTCVLGYLDGDGSVMINRERNNNGVYLIKRLRVVFTCGSKSFLKVLAKNIHKCLNVNQVNVYNGHRSFALHYSTNDSIELFKFLYGSQKKMLFSLRKYNIFKKYFKIKPYKIDSGVKRIIRNINNGRVVK